MEFAGGTSPSAIVRAAGASGPPNRYTRYPAMRSASAPAPDVTTTVVAESTVNVSAGVICTDTGIGTMECASRAAAAGCGGPGGCGRPHAARTNAALDTNAPRT